MTGAAQGEETSFDSSRFADRLYGSAITGVLMPPPTECISLDEAYDAQQRVFEKRGTQVAGWKLGLTSAAAQERMRLSCPVIGRLAASDILASGHKVDSAPGILYAEAELAVMLQSDLPSRAEPYGSGDVASAIGPVHAAIELCTSRYTDDEVGAPALVVDNAFAYRLVVGRTLATAWSSRLASMIVALDCGPARSIVGSTASVMGNPIEAVVWLANWLSSRGEGLKRGQVIATGSCTAVTDVHPGDTVRALFAGAEGAAVMIIPFRETRRFG